MDYLFSKAFYETLVAVVIIIVVMILSKTFDTRYKNSFIKAKEWYRSVKTIREILTSLFVLIMVMIILSINGINVGKYLASFGVIGIILSFSLQDLLKDLIMGFTILIEGYYKVGDVIEYDGMVGKVKSLNLKTTKIFLIDTENTISICNRYLDKVAIVSDWLDINIPIGYDIDLYYSRLLCKECAKRIERLRYVYSCDFLNTSELAESWIEYRLRVHCLPEKKPPVRRASLAVVQDVFYEHKTEFPLSIKVIYQQNTENNNLQINNLENNIKAISDNAHTAYKRDYEYGHGAAKSKEIKVDKDNSTSVKAINESERYATSENLSNKMKIRIRLLSEELLSLIKGIPQIEEGLFYIERDGADYDICFESNSKIDSKHAKNLISVSSSQTNDAYVGFSGMVAKAVDTMVLMSRDGKSHTDINQDNSITESNNEYRWSYNIYKENEANQNENEKTEGESEEIKPVDWSEIERSVLSKFSDDIKIYVRSNQINIRVLVKSLDEN